jgi:protein TonB
MTSAAAKTAALMALGISLAAHAMVFGGAAIAPPSAPSGGEEAQSVALLGNDFADLAQGAAQPVGADTIKPVRPAQDTARPVTPELTAPRALQTSTALPVATTVEPVQDAAPLTSARPRPRPQKTAARMEKPKPTQRVTATSGAKRNAKRGTEQGAKTGVSAKSQGQKNKQVAQPARRVSPQKYAAEVIRKIRATRKARGVGRGSAVVGFEIRRNGALASVRVVRSSGSATRDAAARDHIRRAAPFAPPPQGHARYSFEFVAQR